MQVQQRTDHAHCMTMKTRTTFSRSAQATENSTEMGSLRTAPLLAETEEVQVQLASVLDEWRGLKSPDNGGPFYCRRWSRLTQG